MVWKHNDIRESDERLMSNVPWTVDRNRVWTADLNPQADNWGPKQKTERIPSVIKETGGGKRRGRRKGRVSNSVLDRVIMREERGVQDEGSAVKVMAFHPPTPNEIPEDLRKYKRRDRKRRR